MPFEKGLIKDLERWWKYIGIILGIYWEYDGKMWIDVIQIDTNCIKLLPCHYIVITISLQCPNNVPQCHHNIITMPYNAPHLYPFIFYSYYIHIHFIFISYSIHIDSIFHPFNIHSPSFRYLSVFFQLFFVIFTIFSPAHPLISLWYHVCINFAEVFKMQCCEDAVTRCIIIYLELWEWVYVDVCMMYVGLGWYFFCWFSVGLWDAFGCNLYAFYMQFNMILICIYIVYIYRLYIVSI